MRFKKLFGNHLKLVVRSSLFSQQAAPTLEAGGQELLLMHCPQQQTFAHRATRSLASSSCFGAVHTQATDLVQNSLPLDHVFGNSKCRQQAHRSWSSIRPKGTAAYGQQQPVNSFHSSSSSSSSSSSISGVSDSTGGRLQGAMTSESTNQQQQQQQANNSSGSSSSNSKQQPPPLRVDQPLAAAYGPRKVTLQSAAAAGVQKREGIVHVNSTFNNTIMVLTDRDHKVKTWTSGGTVGYKNANKATPMAAELAAKELASRALEMGFHSVVVKLKGMGKNKQFAVQSLAANGLTVTQLWDVTPIPYNGCRLPRRRRV